MVEKNVKGFLVLGILGLFMISMMAGVIASTDAEQAGEIIGTQAGEFGREVGAFFTGLFGDTLLGNDTLGRIFMALLIGMFVYSALGTFFNKEDQKWVLNLATIAATGLAILGLPKDFLESVLTGYGAMGAAILMIVPFLVIFWFTVKVKNVMLARGIWLFYTVYYFAMYLSELFGGISQTWPNFVAIVLGGIMFLFILKVRNLIFKEELVSNVEEATKRMNENKAAKDISEEIWRGQSGIGKE